MLIPLVMLNACLIFSWSNKVPFDREASDTIRSGINSDWQTGAEGVWRGREEWAQGASWQSGDPWVVSRGYLESVIGDLSDPDGENVVCVRNKSPAG
jgi:hypothetical protein